MSTPSRDPAEGPDSPHAQDAEPPSTPDAGDPGETRADLPAAAGDDYLDRPAETEPAGTLAPEEMAFVYETEEPARTPVAEETLSDIPVVTEPPAAHEPRFDTLGMEEPAFDTLGPEEPAYDTLGPEEPAFDTFAPETPEVAEAVREAEPNWPPLVRKLTLGQAIVMVTGVLLFIFSFLPWYSDAGGSANAWSTVTIPGLLLTATWVPLLSLAIVIFIAIKIFGNGFPDTVLGFTWTQLSIVVGFIDVLITLGFLVANRSLGSLGSLDLGPGLILSFIASLVLLGGAVMDHLGMEADFFSRSPQRRVRSGGRRAA